MDLIDAAGNGDIQSVHELLDRGLGPNIIDNYGDTALMLASSEGHNDIVNTLLRHDANPNIQNIYGWTALIYASLDGHSEIVKMLLDNDADPNIITNEGNTVLMQASRRRRGYIDIVRMLLDNGADPNIRNNSGDTALMMAESKGYNNVARLIRDHIDLRRLQRPQQNLAFMKYFLDRDDLDIDTASRIFGNERSYNPGVSRRTRDEHHSHMMLEDENAMMADYLNTLNQYGSGKRRSKRSGKRRSKRSGKRRSKRTKKKRNYRFY
jgi:hypothetical protein